MSGQLSKASSLTESSWDNLPWVDSVWYCLALATVTLCSQKCLSRNHCCRRRLKPSCWIVGSFAWEELNTWANFQFFPIDFWCLNIPGPVTEASCIGDSMRWLDECIDQLSWAIYTLLHELICSSVPSESRRFSVGEDYVTMEEGWNIDYQRWGT